MNNKVPIDKLFRYCRFTLHYNQLFKLYSSIEYRRGGSVVESSPRMQDIGEEVELSLPVAAGIRIPYLPLAERTL